MSRTAKREIDVHAVTSAEVDQARSDGRADGWVVANVLNAVIGTVFLLLTASHLASTPLEHLSCSIMLGTGALFTLATFMNNPSRLLSRGLAVGTTVLMFAFFATFFRMASSFGEGWYQGVYGIEAISMLVAAFALIPVLASHSCRLKADCPQQRKQPGVGFFSAPIESRK